jgi:hypothetical protein
VAISVGVFFFVFHFALDKKEEEGVLQQGRP